MDIIQVNKISLGFSKKKMDSFWDQTVWQLHCTPRPLALPSLWRILRGDLLPKFLSVSWGLWLCINGKVFIYASHKVKNTSSTILFPAKDFQLIRWSSVINNLCKQKNSSLPYLWRSQKGEIWLWHSNKGTNSRKFSYWCGHRRNLASRPAHTVHRLNIMVLTSTVRLVHIRCYKKREKDVSTLNDNSNYAIMAGLYRIASKTQKVKRGTFPMKQM